MGGSITIEVVFCDNSKMLVRLLAFPFIYLKLKHSFDFSKFRSSHRRCSVKKGVLRNFVKLTGKYLCQNISFLIKLQALGNWKNLHITIK